MTEATAKDLRLAAARVSGKLRLADLRLRKLEAELFQPNLSELLQTLTARMGLPGVVLDLVQSPMDLAAAAAD